MWDSMARARSALPFIGSPGKHLPTIAALSNDAGHDVAPAERPKLQRLIDISLVERIDHRYYMTEANAPLQREVLLAHLRNMQLAIKEVSKVDTAGPQGD
jgi:hypothetical protein